MGKVVLVTGASSGIGQAIAHRLFARRCRVYGTSRGPNPGEEHPFMVLPLDVTSGDSIRACVERVLRDAGRIDVLVNNAGAGFEGLVEEADMDEALRLFDVNFWGMVRMTRAVLPVMRAQGNGHIVNIGSVAGAIALPGMGYYSASKAALARFTEALWAETEPLGIRVSLVEPWFVRTRFYAAAFRASGHIADYSPARTAVFRRLAREFSNGADPDLVARTVERAVYARTPRSRYRIGIQAYWFPFARAVVPDRLFLAVYRRWFR